MQVQTQQDPILTFLQQVTPKVGPANAVSMIRDAQLEAFRKLFLEMGITEAHINEVVNASLVKVANDILKMPVASPVQINKSR